MDHPLNRAQRIGQNIVGAPYIAQHSVTGIQVDTDSAPSLDPASIGLQELQINQYGYGVQSASGFSDAHMNVPYAGHPQPVVYSTPDYGMASNGPIVRGESATPDEGRQSNGHYNTLTERPDAKTILEGPKYPKYKCREKRLGSYINWTNQHQSPNKLCDAGLFAAGKDDQCICFNCGVSIVKWQTNDDPLVEHYRISKQQNRLCLFVIQEMAEKYFRSVNISGQNAPLVVGRRRSHRICQACFRDQIAISQFRCGHIVCVECAPVAAENGFCKICGSEVVSTSAYDPTAL